MAITECPQGHLYDPTLYPSCPYCAGGGNMIQFNQPGSTSAPVGYGGAPGATAAPAGYGAGGSGGYEPPVNRTLPIGGDSGGSKTVAPEGYRKKQEEENKTVGTFKRKFDLEPVVGWLACIEGPDKGTSYQLFAKINSIGRSSENDVCIKGDETISRKSHARLAYDPRHNNFQLIPSESTNNIYLNDEPVYTPVRLSAYDRVEFGQSKLVFVPLCCDRFRWDAPDAEAAP